MKYLKLLMALFVVICAVLVPVSADPKPLDMVPLPPLDAQMACSPLLSSLCCGDPNNSEIIDMDNVKDVVCKDVKDGGCDDGTKDICAADAFSSLLPQLPMALLSYIKNVACCNDLKKDIIASIRKAICTKFMNVLCCKRVDYTDINSVKDAFCSNDPCAEYCMNGGTCKYDKDKNETKCTCVDPYVGERCELNPCVEILCKNGGTCSYDKEKNETKCNCVDPYYGERCDPCQEVLCKNGGTCSYDKATNETKCNCMDPYYGERCDPCQEILCKNGGTCSYDKVKNETMCNCVDPYYGERCDPCDEILCKNDGTCSYDKVRNETKCNCVDPYYGERCDPCDEILCKNGGTCSYDKVKKETKCNCVDPYYGDRCDPCDEFICLNGGTCTYNKEIDEKTCNCGLQYDGKHCEYKCCNENDYKWTEHVLKQTPTNAFTACDDGTASCELYPARVKINDIYILGKLKINQYEACYVPNGSGGEMKLKENCEVLDKLKGMRWVKTLDGENQPHCAILGNDQDYVGRGRSQGDISTGGVRNGTLTATYRGIAYTYTTSKGFDYLKCYAEP